MPPSYLCTYSYYYLYTVYTKYMKLCYMIFDIISVCTQPQSTAAAVTQQRKQPNKTKEITFEYPLANTINK